MQTRTALPQHQPGDIIKGRYLIEDTLGSGGFGAVFRVVDIADELLRIPYALKITDITGKTEAETQELRLRFEREGKLARDLPIHPNLVRVHQAGFIDQKSNPNLLYMVQDFVEGYDLHGHTFTLGDALTLFIGALDGLGVLHQRGIIHRDLKPRNLRICAQSGALKILDLGIAKDTQPSNATELTRQGHLMGTLAYLSPESVNPQL